MEFNLELAINAGLAGLRVHEIPIELGPRKGESKLRTFRDGWRSLRMMLLYSPNMLFLLPGALLLVLGLAIHLAVLTRRSTLGWPARRRGDRRLRAPFSAWSASRS